MIINKEILYSLRDISIIPSVVSEIESRSECDPTCLDITGKKKGFLPLITAPMSCVINEDNYKEYEELGISIIIPRTVSSKKRIEMMTRYFCAFSIKEAEDILEFPVPAKSVRYHVLIDVANGHMKKQIELGRKMKEKFGTNVVLMGGNIANPQTFKEYETAGFDFLRVGIGGGCFTPGQKVITIDGSKNIEDIQINDFVKTHDGTYQKVVGLHEYFKDEELYKINNIECTSNHEFYVINIEDEALVNDNNVSDYAFWVSADCLDPEKHLLIEL